MIDGILWRTWNENGRKVAESRTHIDGPYGQTLCGREIPDRPGVEVEGVETTIGGIDCKRCRKLHAETPVQACAACGHSEQSDGYGGFDDCPECGERMQERDAPATCPLCDGEGTTLGTLGALTHHRCRQCGCTFSTGEVD